MGYRTERLLLQLCVAIAAAVPVVAGFAGMLYGTSLFGLTGDRSADSHIRYLSGLLFAIGLAFWSTLPRIETQGERFRQLVLIVLVGALSRAAAIAVIGMPGTGALAALANEIVVAPLLWLWQRRVAALYSARAL
jgi:hypothetical protein